MALKLYDKVKPSGSFPLIDAVDVELPDGKRLDAGLAEAGKLLDENSGERVRMWFGTQAEYDALETHEPDVYYNIYEDVVPT